MIEDTMIRNLLPAAQRSYLHAVAKLSRYFGRSPDQLDLEDVRAYQVHFAERGITWASSNQTVSALRLCNLTSGNLIGVFASSPTEGHALRSGSPLFWYSMKETNQPWRTKYAARTGYGH
jgi:hypothetical protein